MGRPQVRIMQSSGGIVSAAVASREPVRTILSGPAGGVREAGKRSEKPREEGGRKALVQGVAITSWRGAVHGCVEVIRTHCGRCGRRTD